MKVRVLVPIAGAAENAVASAFPVPFRERDRREFQY